MGFIGATNRHFDVPELTALPQSRYGVIDSFQSPHSDQVAKAGA